MVIGNNNYQNIRKLRGAINDATELSSALIMREFNVTQSTNRTKLQMEEDIDNFVNRNFENAPFDNYPKIILFYFSGQGFQINGEDFLLPIDANPNNI